MFELLFHIKESSGPKLIATRLSLTVPQVGDGITLTHDNKHFTVKKRTFNFAERSDIRQTVILTVQ